MNTRVFCWLSLSFWVLLVMISVAQCTDALAEDWTHTWGGSADDRANSIAMDSNGNIYSTGSTRSFGAGGADVLLLKYDPSGSLLWSKTWGGFADDNGIAIKVDGIGNVYVAGSTASFGAGWYDALLLKFDANGNLLWSRTWGGGSFEQAYDIALDASGNIYLAAESYSYGLSAVLLKFSSNGDLLWTRTWKGPATYDATYSLDIDNAGNIYLAGISWDYSAGDHRSILLLKYDSQGNLVWNKNWTGPGNDEASGSKVIRVDGGGNIYLASRTSSFGAGDYDVLMLKLDNNGNLIWARTWGGAGYESGYGLAFDSAGNVIVAGQTKSFLGGVSSALLLKYATTGNLLSSKIWGGNGDAGASSVWLNQAGNAFVTGWAPNDTGSWQDVTGAVGSPSASIISPSGYVGAPSGITTSPVGTIGTPTGVIDTGGGASDAFVVEVSTGAGGPRVFTPPYNDCIASASHSASPPQGDHRVLSQGFSAAVAKCDPSAGTFRYEATAFGGTRGGFNTFSKTNPPNQAAHTEAAIVLQFIPEFSGGLRVDVNLTFNGKVGAAAGSGLAASINLVDLVGGSLIDYLTGKQLSTLLDILKTLLAPTVATARTEVFFRVSGGASGGASTLLTGAGAEFPLPGPYNQNVSYDGQTVKLSTVVQVTQGQTIQILTGAQSDTKSWGWAASVANLAGIDSRVESIVLTKE
jgi:hypothetical protein